MLVACACTIAYVALRERSLLLTSNFYSRDGETHGYCIWPDTPIDSIEAMLLLDYNLRDRSAFRRHIRWIMKDSVARPGYYRLDATFGDKRLLDRLRLGQQSEYRLALSHTMRTPEQVAARLGKTLMLDSLDIISRLQDETYLMQFGLTPETATCLFLPDTYYVYWTMTPDEFFERMAKEYNRFWNDLRRQKAAALGFSPVEIHTLASIVNSETFRAAEWPAIASLYLNRLEKGMLLQADPTVVYANRCFGARRVLRTHLAIDSPYNTYKYRGLPPGPIRCALPACIDSVLAAPKTKYLYMCANPDFSGTHVFTTTYTQHLNVARQYQRELNRRHIRK